MPVAMIPHHNHLSGEEVTPIAWLCSLRWIRRDCEWAFPDNIAYDFIGFYNSLFQDKVIQVEYIPYQWLRSEDL